MPLPTARSWRTAEVTVTAALVFEGVSKTFFTAGLSVRALQSFDISIQVGKVTGLIGPDGVGKTTLMRLAAGLLRPDEGRIHALDINVVEQPLEVQSSVGYMPQRFGLYEDLSVQENLDLYADLQGVAKAERSALYQELMHMTGLAPFTRRLAGRLSGGMKQKLGLACTLVRPPRLLLLDEATVGVDPVSRRELWAIVYRQVREHGMSVLLSTAYLDEAERCDAVVLMHEGKRLGQGSPESFSKPMRGRTFRITAPGLGKRTLQLSRTCWVIHHLAAIYQGQMMCSRIAVLTVLWHLMSRFRSTSHALIHRSWMVLLWVAVSQFLRPRTPASWPCSRAPTSSDVYNRCWAQLNRCRMSTATPSPAP